MTRWLLIIVVLIAGCTSGPRPDHPAQTTSPTEVELHSDITPIADEFPKITGIKEVSWLEIVGGDPRIPGPSTFRLQALIYLDDDDAAKLRDAHEWAPAMVAWADSVHPKFSPKIVDPTSWVRSHAYDQDFGSKNHHYKGGFTAQLDAGILYFMGGT